MPSRPTFMVFAEATTSGSPSRRFDLSKLRYLRGRQDVHPGYQDELERSGLSDQSASLDAWSL